MPKKTKQQKAKTSKTKLEPKNNEQRQPAQVVPEPALTSPKPERLIRAIAVTREILEAAKAYKRVTRISFYQLGLETISERLVKEGYLKRAGESKPLSREVEIAKS
jgi:hypothetical protein